MPVFAKSVPSFIIPELSRMPLETFSSGVRTSDFDQLSFVHADPALLTRTPSRWPARWLLRPFHERTLSLKRLL